MNENIDLEKLEKKAAAAIFQDGIFDISLGHALIAFGIASWLYGVVPETLSTILGIVIYLAVIIPIWFVNFFVTRPRLGIVKFGIKRRRRSTLVITIVSITLIANIVIFILLFTDVIQFNGQLYLLAAIFGLIPLVIFTGMAFFLSYNRLYVIGPLFSVAIFLKEFLTLQDLELISNIVYTGVGVIIVTIGLVYLIRFLKKYPKVEVDSNEFGETGSQ
ncbi:MAG: hypothetical protein EAX90_00520 [Candidatus Heimdallarchaeota archaeon]|nr:hypothetical protein [Candidatus Heimdallarchaeota archaeon]